MKNFKFNHIIALFVIYSMAICPITAQSNLNFSMKGGFFAGEMSLNPSLEVVHNGRQSFEIGSGSVSMAFSLPIVKKFRLGAEVGLNHLNEFFDKTITFSTGSSVAYLGYYRINQAFAVLVPEYRILPWFFVNAGGGYYTDFNSSFTNGSTFTSGGSRNDITGQTAKREKSVGGFIGVGACPNVTKDLAILAELRLVGSPNGSDSPDRLNVGYSGVNISIGLMYKPR
jgi:hypothetical protein